MTNLVVAHTREVIDPIKLIVADTVHSDEVKVIAKSIADFIDYTISFAPGWTGLSIRPNSDQAPRTAWFEAWRGDQLAHWSLRAAFHNVNGASVHLNMMTRKAKLATTVRGGDDDVETGFTLWADFDEPNPDIPVKLLESDMPPHMIVASGGEHRYHAYWMCKSLLEPASVHARLLGLARQFGKVDEATTRPSTMMRVPGTINWKYPVRSGIIYDGIGDFRQYMYDEFQSLESDEDKLATQTIRRPRVVVTPDPSANRVVYTAAQVADMCHGRFVPNRREWMAHCPAPTHGKGRGDKSESLTIKQVDDRVLLSCFAMCDVSEICRGLNIPVSSLFSTESRPMTALEQRALRAQKKRGLDKSK